jgi:hypothetical protein
MNVDTIIYSILEELTKVNLRVEESASIKHLPTKKVLIVDKQGKVYERNQHYNPNKEYHETNNTKKIGVLNEIKKKLSNESINTEIDDISNYHKNPTTKQALYLHGLDNTGIFNYSKNEIITRISSILYYGNYHIQGKHKNVEIKKMIENLTNILKKHNIQFTKKFKFNNENEKIEYLKTLVKTILENSVNNSKLHNEFINYIEKKFQSIKPLSKHKFKDRYLHSLKSLINTYVAKAKIEKNILDKLSPIEFQDVKSLGIVDIKLIQRYYKHLKNKDLNEYINITDLFYSHLTTTEIENINKLPKILLTGKIKQIRLKDILSDNEYKNIINSLINKFGIIETLTQKEYKIGINQFVNSLIKRISIFNFAKHITIKQANDKKYKFTLELHS